MSTNNPITVVNLDFNDIKTALVAYFSSQTEFTDYNFEGSALNVILDLLSYNTHYGALLASLAANEGFIDTAIKRSSVVSIAKTLGYTPRSTTSSVATVNIVIVPTGNETTLVLDTADTFTTNIDNVLYTFQPQTSQTATLQNGVFTFSNVILVEGTQLTNSFAVTSDLTSGPFVIPVTNIDSSTLKVWVQNSISDVGVTVWTQATTIVDVINTTKVFWLEENSAGQYQVVFGDDIIGASLALGNIVQVSYLASNGSGPNGANVFSPTGAIDGEINVSVTTVNAASGGNEPETIDQIRFNAPKYNITKNRAVTAQDYTSIILANLPKAKSVVVWGGEDNIPPVYGKVFISVDPIQPYVVTDIDKSFLVDDVLKPRGIMGIQYEFIDPEYVYLSFNIRVSYDPTITNLTASQIAILVNGAIIAYFNTNLGTLDKTFYLSQFTDALTSINPSILGVLIQMQIQQRITSTSSFTTTNDLQFLASLVPGSIMSTAFVSAVNGVSYTAYIQDFSDSSVPNPNGTGTMKLLQYGTGNVLVSNIGTVNYGTGVVSFTNLNIQQYLGNIIDVRINATPQDWSKNISPAFVTLTQSQEYSVLPQPARNVILQLDDSTINQSIGLNAGVTVTATPIANA